jgi:hypothetical protein
MKLKYTNIDWKNCEEKVLKLQRKIIAAWKEKERNGNFNVKKKEK